MTIAETALRPFRRTVSTPKWPATWLRYRADLNDWEKAWQLCQRKYRDPEYQKASNGGIDCKINGAYVLLGLLWGQRDP